jgi:hypothetical protein
MWDRFEASLARGRPTWAHGGNGGWYACRGVRVRWGAVPVAGRQDWQLVQTAAARLLRYGAVRLRSGGAFYAALGVLGYMAARRMRRGERPRPR